MSLPSSSPDCVRSSVIEHYAMRLPQLASCVPDSGVLAITAAAGIRSSNQINPLFEGRTPTALELQARSSNRLSNRRLGEHDGAVAVSHSPHNLRAIEMCDNPMARTTTKCSVHSAQGQSWSRFFSRSKRSPTTRCRPQRHIRPI